MGSGAEAGTHSPSHPTTTNHCPPGPPARPSSNCPLAMPQTCVYQHMPPPPHQSTHCPPTDDLTAPTGLPLSLPLPPGHDPAAARREGSGPGSRCSRRSGGLAGRCGTERVREGSLAYTRPVLEEAIQPRRQEARESREQTGARGERPQGWAGPLSLRTTDGLRKGMVCASRTHKARVALHATDG